MQFRLKECFDAQKRNEKTYLKEILKLHIELNDYIIKNGVDSFAEKKITDTLQIINIYDSFNLKIKELIDRLKHDIKIQNTKNKTE